MNAIQKIIECGIIVLYDCKYPLHVQLSLVDILEKVLDNSHVACNQYYILSAKPINFSCIFNVDNKQ